MPLEFRGQLLELSEGKDWPILANVLTADIASPTDPDAALHPLLQGSDDLFIPKLEPR